MQEKTDSLKSFLDRFGRISVRQGKSIVQCCKDAGIARSLFYEIRNGNRAVSDKVWAKLEQAELKAGIVVGVDQGTGGFADRSANPKDSPVAPGEKVSADATLFQSQTLEEQVRQMREQFRQIQSAFQSAPFTLAELESWMRTAGAWPASEADRQLSPGTLWRKYAPESSAESH